ncbi:azadirone synthase LFS-like isoform X1 [Wolffia australiana]
MDLQLPVVDFASSDRASTSKLIRQACLEHGFFYLVNHGIEEEFLGKVFDGSRRLFSLPLQEKMKLLRNEGHRGYTPPFAEKLDTSMVSKGDPKESFYIGPMAGDKVDSLSNQWPPEETLPDWRRIMELYYEKVVSVGKTLLSLIALALKLDEGFFEDVGALHEPMAFLRLLHYPESVSDSLDSNLGASAHTDYGMITLLACDGVRGLQICKEKDENPRVWEDVAHLEGALVINVGDLLERWTNCFFRSTLHRVVSTGKERYSIACFLDPNPECVVKCLDTCISESNPPRFPPVRSGDYLKERLRMTYGETVNSLTMLNGLGPISQL